jgi:predicted acetyltransferase
LSGWAVTVETARIEDKEIVRRLLELSAFELSRFDGSDTDGRAGRGYRYLDAYWLDAARHPFLIRVRGQIAGLCLVREGAPHSIAEFLILPEYPRTGAGTVAARTIFARFPGEWEVREIPGNEAAVAFWRRAIPTEFVETVGADGTVQRFTILD